MTVVLRNILFSCLLFRCVSCFLPSRISAVLNTDFTMEDIIEIALTHIAAENDKLDTEVNLTDHYDYKYLREKLSPATQGTSDMREADVREADVREADIREVDVGEAVSEIVSYCNLVDRDQQGNPVWEFADEKITDVFLPYLNAGDGNWNLYSYDRGTNLSSHVTGHMLLLRLRDRLLQILSPKAPNLRAARETLGQIFHLLLKFYSNTNWLESGNTKIYKNLGIPGRPMVQVAPPTLSTCVACGETVHNTCRDNLLTVKFLTSGYFGSRLHVDNPVDHVPLHGKCRHGGIQDRGSQPVAVPGGINKESGSPEFSPHYFLHNNAARLAIQHVGFYLFDKDVGLFNLLGSEKFSRLFVAASGMPSVFVDVQNGTVRDDIIHVLHVAKIRILDTAELKNVCLRKGNAVVIIQFRGNGSVNSFDPWQCENRRTHIVNIQEAGPNTTGSRQKRALSGLDIYHLIADTSGGTVYETDKSNIAAVVDIIKESVSTKPPVTVMKFQQASSSSNEFVIPIDNLIHNLTIKVQGSLHSVPNMNLFRPSGTLETFRDASVATAQTLGSKLRVIKLFNPTPGKWKMKRMSSLDVDVDVTASTDLDFSYQFMQSGPGGFGDYPLIGRPIAGENTTVQVSVPLVDKLGSVDSLLLLDRKGSVVQSNALHNVGGRRGKSLFKAYITIPSKEFEISVEGTDKSGNSFRRLDPKIISSLGIQLEVLPSSGTLYINQSITIPYRVRNVGGASTTITVSITDDKGFAQSPTTRSHSVSGHGSQNGSFTLKAGPVKGETTTMTISAKAAGTSNSKVQFNVRRITVEEKIVRVLDTKAPTCNVTSTKGKCDFGADICQCSKQSWEMTAIVGDDGDGLQSVFSSGAGNSSTFTHDKFSPGHTIAKGVIHTSLRADCCHQQAKITVVDLAGNVGLCDVVITPGFVAPDPKLCTAPSNVKPSKTNANITTISCNITNIVDSCNGSSLGCERTFWSVEAKLGNEGFGRMQIAPINAGKNANVTRINNTVTLSTDCCHSDVYINVVDIAGHTGQCHVDISTADKEPSSPSSGSSSSVAVIAGGIAGGVVVIGTIAGLVYYLKTRIPSGKVSQDSSPVRSIS